MNSTAAHNAIGSIWCGETESKIKRIQRVGAPAPRIDLQRSEQKREPLLLKEKSTEREKPISPPAFRGVIQNIGR